MKLPNLHFQNCQSNFPNLRNLRILSNSTVNLYCWKLVNSQLCITKFSSRIILLDWKITAEQIETDKSVFSSSIRSLTVTQILNYTAQNISKVLLT